MLKENNPFSHPVLYPAYLSDDRDVEIIIKGIRRAVQLSETTSFQKYGAQLYKTPLSPCSSNEFDSDAYWECSVRYMTFTMFHQAGTCKMGPGSDSDAVVDSSLRVREIKHLRVSGASVMPLVPSGHIMATVYMIAEKTADSIKQTWLRS
jgi:choline dehydrogenase